METELARENGKSFLGPSPFIELIRRIRQWRLSREGKEEREKLLLRYLVR